MSCKGSITNGTFTVTESSFEGFGGAVETGRTAARIQVRSSDFALNDVAVFTAEPMGGQLVIDRNEVTSIDRERSVGGSFGFFVVPGESPALGDRVQVRVTNNDITIPNAGDGVIIVQGPTPLTSRVRGNTISLNQENTAGIVLVGATAGSVTDNSVSGLRDVGVILPRSSGVTVRGNTFADASGSADILLTPDSSNNTVIAGGATVLDLGTDNDIR